MGEKTNFLLQGDIIPMTEDDIDNIESLYVPSGDTTGSNITSEDIDELLKEGDLSDNEEGSSVPSDIPEGFEGPISDSEVDDILNS